MVAFARAGAEDFEAAVFVDADDFAFAEEDLAPVRELALEVDRVDVDLLAVVLLEVVLLEVVLFDADREAGLAAVFPVPFVEDFDADLAPVFPAVAPPFGLAVAKVSPFGSFCVGHDHPSRSAAAETAETGQSQMSGPPAVAPMPVRPRKIISKRGIPSRRL